MAKMNEQSSKGSPMERRRQTGLFSRRDTLTLLGALAATRGASAAEPGILQPATLDHVNLRVSNVTKSGEGYLVVSTAFAPDPPGLDHYSVGIRNYEQGKLATKLNDTGIAAEARSADVWVRDPDGTFIQLRTTGGWARQSAAPMQRPNGGPSLSPLGMSRIVLRSADLARGGDFYGRVYGTEVASAATS